MLMIGRMTACCTATHVSPDSMHTLPDDRWNISAYLGPMLNLRPYKMVVREGKLCKRAW